MTTATNTNIHAAVLAAGMASRFGSTKQLAVFAESPLVRRSVDAAIDACGSNTSLVLGHDWRAVSEACGTFDGFIIVNDRYAEGIGTSIAAATRCLQHVAAAIIVVLADQPLVSGTHLVALCDTWSGSETEIIATAFQNTLGPPVLFPRGAYEQLGTLAGDTGARSLLRDGSFDVRSVSFEDAAVDIDTRQDLDAG